MNSDSYRQIQAYAHSDLCELFNLRMGKPARSINEKAATFGTTFHQLILEPEKPVDWSRHHVTEHDKLNQMRDSLNLFIDKHYQIWPSYRHDVEVIRTWTCSNTGLPLKARLDACPDEAVMYPDDPVYDLKTTKCRTSQEFFDTFVPCGYDRQAAFYLDGGFGGYNFVFVGVQKVKPFDVFVIDMSVSTDRKRMIDAARAKNARLLRDAKAESLKINGWVPSSWSRKEEV